MTPLGQEEKEGAGCVLKKCDIFVLVNWPLNKAQKEAGAVWHCFLTVHFLCFTILQDTVVNGWLCSMVKKNEVRYRLAKYINSQRRELVIAQLGNSPNYDFLLSSLA